MILSILRNYPLAQAIPILLFSVIIVLSSLTIHETSHGIAALALGDDTAKSRGRLSLNPMKHLDPIGTLCMLLVGFGWAIPVPINPRNFKSPKWGMAISALAGPVSNLILSFLSLLLYVVAGSFLLPLANTGILVNIAEMLCVFFFLAHQMNLYLAVFNLIPVPPLDGSRILSVFLPADKYFKVMRYEKYIAVGLMVLLYIGVLDGPLSFITNGITSGMIRLIRLIL